LRPPNKKGRKALRQQTTERRQEPTTKSKAMTQQHTPINEEPVTVPNHFNELSEVKLKYHLLVEELEEA
jgi:hypothetical protein